MGNGRAPSVFLKNICELWSECLHNVSSGQKVFEKERGGTYLAIKHVFVSLWAQKVEFRHQKLTWMSEYSNPISSFILQNLNFFHFSWHIIWLVRRVVTIFYWRKELGLADLSNSLNMFVKSTENFLQAFEKKVLLQKKLRFCKMKFEIRLEYSDKASFFEAKFFFQRLVENFLWALRTCSSYWKGLPNLVLCVSKNIVTTLRTNQIIY